MNSQTDQEVWGVNIDFQSIHSKGTIDAFLQHMGFYVTTENPNLMMKENHNTQSCEYIIICQDGLYIASITPEEIGEFILIFNQFTVKGQLMPFYNVWVSM